MAAELKKAVEASSPSSERSKQKILGGNLKSGFGIQRSSSTASMGAATVGSPTTTSSLAASSPPGDVRVNRGAMVSD